MLVQTDSAEKMVHPLGGRPGFSLEWVIRIFLLVAVCFTFWPAVHAGFVNWDDGLNIVENPHLGFSWEKIRWMFTDTDYVRRYAPLGWASYSVDRQFFG